MTTYNSQTLLFDQSPRVVDYGMAFFDVPSDFYNRGFVLIPNIADEHQARRTLESFIASISTERLPLYQRFLSRIQLAKANLIPVCDDSIATGYQALHFDMGHPIVFKGAQNLYLVVGLYFPSQTILGEAKTRVLGLSGLFCDKSSDAAGLESKLVAYAERYGDGWGTVNTGRLQCFARYVDAVYGKCDLRNYRDKRMAEWFQESGSVNENSLASEYAFYHAHELLGVPEKEKHVILQPGQLLILDNTRTVHGRLGKRSKEEIYQFMFGVRDATAADVHALRKSLCDELASC